MPDRAWTPWELRPERQYLRTLCGAYYDWQRWEISARLRGVQRLKRATRDDLLAIVEGRVEPPEPPPEPRKRRGRSIAPVDLTPAQLLCIDALADQADTTLEGYLKEIREVLPSFGAHWTWLDAQHGIGPVMGGFLLANFDPHRADRPSGYWKFAGLHVVPGEGGLGRAPHPERGQKNEYAKGVRVKLLGVLAPSIMKAAVRKPPDADADTTEQDLINAGWWAIDTHLGKRYVRSPYSQAYFQYRWRIGTDPTKKWGHDACARCTKEMAKGGTRVTIQVPMENGKCPKCKSTEAVTAGADGHMATAALRYLAKMFLLDFWKEQRRIEGLVVVPSYHEAMRGYPHRAAS